MTYEELIKKEKELVDELKAVKDEIALRDEKRAKELLQIVIQSLVEFQNITGNEFNCEFEIYCDECDKEFDFCVSIDDVVQSLIDLKEKEF